MMRRVIWRRRWRCRSRWWRRRAGGACGGLVGENGTIQLGKTTTLAAYTGGVERYVTAFQFTGGGRVGGLARAAARRAHRGDQGGRLDAPAPGAGGDAGRRRA